MRPADPSPALSSALAALETMDAAALRAEWRKRRRADPPPSLSRDILMRGIAHALQEAAFGGLRPTDRKRLAVWEEHAIALRAGTTPATGGTPGPVVPDALRLRPGTVLLRAWNGRTYRVEVLEAGYRLADETFSSLTQVARNITGAHWSGPRFFGLKASRRG